MKKMKLFITVFVSLFVCSIFTVSAISGEIRAYTQDDITKAYEKGFSEGVVSVEQCIQTYTEADIAIAFQEGAASVNIPEYEECIQDYTEADLALAREEGVASVDIPGNPEIGSDFNITIPNLIYTTPEGTASFWGYFEFIPGPNGELRWNLVNFGLN